MPHTLLIERTRGGADAAGDIVECQHFGSIAVVDPSGQLVASAGDPHALTFARSALKPFQALPFMRGGGAAHYGLHSEQLALLCASHSGESEHVATVASILDKAGCGPAQLQCGCHLPIAFGMPGGAAAPAGFEPTTLHHNCSGKHAGFLAYCAQHGLTLHDYLSADHPLQAAVRSQLAQACGIAADALRAGIDGCSAPTYALPLSALATGYARLATAQADDALHPLCQAMVAHPFLVSGSGRSDLALMRAAPDELVAKTGADGVQGMGLRKAGLGIAVKVSDGNMATVHAAAIETLRQLGVPAAQSGTLQAWARPDIRNTAGLRTGQVRPAFELRHH
ncbi:asparaginase [Bordetella sp. BOR01]|uniref:asparaginase n=1 Tax=Bordetella sp. BOR01 TaxID=2854779 RepID=UPI001C494044|nr:asparaginase [Bordetella sp. BOR01]MBV7486440.1 asparaginase [Bordetella sp. BOR01]